jgi:phage terminase large subunit
MALIEIPYSPRPQFEPYHDRKERFAKIVAHRRFGKTVGCINDKIKTALTNTRQFPPPRYSYVAPTYTQAKDIAWGYLKHYSAPIPGIKMSESELWVEYPNGARIRLYGADNYDRMRGLYNDGVTIDEPAQMDPRAWPEVIRPTLADYAGWATFIGTPKGKDWFYRIDRGEDGKELPDFFRLTLKASETGVIPAPELASLRAGMSEDQFNREMECSFDAAIEGAYFARLLGEAKTQGRIGRVAADPLLPKRAYVDIGGSGKFADAFTIWIVQFVAQEIRVLHYYEAIGQVLGFHLNWLRKNGYEDVIIRLPHDGINENNLTGKRYEDHIREAGFKVEPSLPNQGKGAAQMRIEAVRRILPKCWFNESTTEPGREALMAYSEKRDEERNVGLGPDHNWASHAADAFGLMAVCYEEPSRSAGFGRGISYPKMGYA